MIYIAFTLGLFGSLHCMLMCGPLALSFGTKNKSSLISQLWNALQYNLGRTFSYGILGLVFGLFSTFIFMAGIQKGLTIGIGVILFLVAISSFNLESYLYKFTATNKIYLKVNQTISSLFSKAKTLPTFAIGMINGFLPCGLVYLALAGALSTGTLPAGLMFMIAFGLGTLPMMVSTMILGKNLSLKLPFSFKKISGVVTLCFGLYLIYRGFFVTVPMEMNFYSMLRDPILCH